MSSFILQGGHYEWFFDNGDNTYGKAHILGGTITDGVYTNGSIGNTIARQLNLKLWDVSLDTSEPIVLYVDAVAADGTTSTRVKGTYYIDTIATSPYSDYCEVTAFDAMLKSEVVYLKEGEWTATTDLALITQISTDIGVNIEANTLSLFTASPVNITESPSIGDNGTTSRQILGAIAVIRGGNFIINDYEELELVSLLGKYDVAQVVTIDSNGDFELVPYGLLTSSHDVVSLDANGDFQVIGFASVVDSTELWFVDGDGNDYSDTWENIQALAPIPYPPITIGNEVATFDVSPTETISKIELQVNGNTFRSPQLSEEDWEALAGRCLVASMAFMGSQTLANDLYTKFVGLDYVPHTASKVYADPRLSLGESLSIKNDTVILSNRILNIDSLGSCNLSAEPTQEMQSKYPYIDPVVRETRQRIDSNRVAIEVNQSDITSIVQTFNEELGVNITPLTMKDPTDRYWASSNPDGYWMYAVADGARVTVTAVGDGWYHCEVVTGADTARLNFVPRPIQSLTAENLTLMYEIRNSAYTGTINFGSIGVNNNAQYPIPVTTANPSDGEHYISLVKGTPKSIKWLFAFGTDSIGQNEALSLDIRLSLYVGAYDGAYVPWSPNSYNSRVQQTADGILISLTSKITQAEAQQLVDNYGESVTQYLEFANGTLRLGESNSQFKALLDNTELAFTGADGRKVAWISNSQLYISEAVLNGTLTIRANENTTTSWRQYVRESDNIFCIKVVKPNA